MNKKPLIDPCLPAKETLPALLRKLATVEGMTPTLLPEVTIFFATGAYPATPVSYRPCIVIIAQGKKRGSLGSRTFVYDAGNYLVLSIPLPFQCETFGTPEEPLLGMAVQLNPALVAELLLLEDLAPAQLVDPAQAIDATPVTPEIADAATRLAKCLLSPSEARVLGPQIIREITYRVLAGPRGNLLQAMTTPQSRFGKVARAIRRIHADYAQTLDITSLAREVGMSVSTFHASFKSVTSHPPLRYIQTIRLHKAQVLIVTGLSVAEAARQVGYESPSQFSREFKRLFSTTPREVTNRIRLSM